MSVGRVLVIEDDISRAQNLQELLEFSDFDSLVIPASDAVPWEDCSKPEWLAAIVRESGSAVRSVLASAQRHGTDLPLVTLGTNGEPDAPPQDERICGQLALPLRYPHLMEALERARRWRTERLGDGKGFPVGHSLAIQELDKLIRQVAEFDSTVLICGESGTGKELVARRIHELSGRAGMPFVPLNCGAIPRELLESELFGHERGAFTGAITRRIGRFELAEGGTLFLDEIGDMSLDMQIKLLRVLQERTFERVGSMESRRADVRIIAATHRDLEHRIDEGQFRQDLYFRLNVFPIRVPTLRERPEDLPALIRDIVNIRPDDGRPALTFSDLALQRLRAYEWPGNVRELANIIERTAILSANGFVDLKDLPPFIIGSEPGGRYDEFAEIPSGGLDLREYVGSIERNLIRRALDQSNGTVAQAARLLNLRRTTLVEKLRKYDLASSDHVAAGSTDAEPSKI